MSETLARNRSATLPVVFVNDEPRGLSANASVATLVRELGLADRKGVAIAIGGSVLPRTQWATRLLLGGERLLVIRATQGG